MDKVNHGKIVAIFGGCHSSLDGLLGKAIVVFTTWPWRWFKMLKVSTHSSVGFQYEDGYEEIFEAREGKSWQGPIDATRVDEWVRRKPRKRRFTKYYIPDHLIGQEGLERKYELCVHNLSIWTYSIKQLPRMGLRKYLPHLPINATPNEVVCSEGATIVMEPQIPVMANVGKDKADLVTPFLFEKAMKRICKKPTHAPSDTSDAYNT